MLKERKHLNSVAMTCEYSIQNYREKAGVNTHIFVNASMVCSVLNKPVNQWMFRSVRCFIPWLHLHPHPATPVM